jgi:hypothetical protein
MPRCCVAALLLDGEAAAERLDLRAAPCVGGLHREVQRATCQLLRRPQIELGGHGLAAVRDL